MTQDVHNYCIHIDMCTGLTRSNAKEYLVDAGLIMCHKC